MAHISVLTNEVVHGLALAHDATVIDATLGAGGHARALIDMLDRSGTFLGIDADERAIQAASTLKDKSPNVMLEVGNFKDIAALAKRAGITHVDAILADLGWRMEQFESGQKGFSFLKDEPLLMTYGDPKDYIFTAYDIINEWEETSITDVLFGYGEEHRARRIAKQIVTRRTEAPIRTSGALADLITEIIPRGRSKIHPATKTFQALRIAVNDELGVLKMLIQDGFTILRPGGRMAIISFHSIEDRIIKNAFRTFQKEGSAILTTKHPIVASDEERRINPRARSAKLRIIEKKETHP